MRRIALQIFGILSFIVSIIWFLYEPGFEPFLAFLSGIISLIESGKEKEEEYKYTHDVEREESNDTPGKPIHTNRRRQVTKDQRIAQNLYQNAFTVFHNNVRRIVLTIVLTAGFTLLILVLHLDTGILFFVWLISAILMYFQFTRMIMTLDRQINSSGYYHRQFGVPQRKNVKRLLLEEQWGNTFDTLFMKSLITLLLMPELKDFKRFKKSLGITR